MRHSTFLTASHVSVFNREELYSAKESFGEKNQVHINLISSKGAWPCRAMMCRNAMMTSLHCAKSCEGQLSSKSSQNTVRYKGEVNDKYTVWPLLKLWRLNLTVNRVSQQPIRESLHRFYSRLCPLKLVTGWRRGDHQKVQSSFVFLGLSDCNTWLN